MREDDRNNNNENHSNLNKWIGVKMYGSDINTKYLAISIARVVRITSSESQGKNETVAPNDNYKCVFELKCENRNIFGEHQLDTKQIVDPRRFLKLMTKLHTSAIRLRVQLRLFDAKRWTNIIRLVSPSNVWWCDILTRLRVHVKLMKKLFDLDLDSLRFNEIML